MRDLPHPRGFAECPSSRRMRARFHTSDHRTIRDCGLRRAALAATRGQKRGYRGRHAYPSRRARSGRPAAARSVFPARTACRYGGRCGAVQSVEGFRRYPSRRVDSSFRNRRFDKSRIPPPAECGLHVRQMYLRAGRFARSQADPKFRRCPAFPAIRVCNAFPA